MTPLALLINAGVPSSLADRVLDGAEVADTWSMRIVTAWYCGGVLEFENRSVFDGNDRVLVLSGRPGCGKSFAAATCVAVAGGKWLRAQDLENPHRALDECASASLCVIDQVGAEYIGPRRYPVARFWSLLDKRTASGLRTIITTWVNADEFFDRYGEEFKALIRRHGRYVGTSDPDIRGVK